jgi:hypothetical protein
MTLNNGKSNIFDPYLSVTLFYISQNLNRPGENVLFRFLAS